MTGGWLFGFVEALDARGRRHEPRGRLARGAGASTRWRHRPTGAPLVVLPVPRAYRRVAPHASPTRTAGTAQDSALAHGRRGAARRPAGASNRALSRHPGASARARATPDGRRRRSSAKSTSTSASTFARLWGASLGMPVVATFQGGDGPRTGLERVVRPISVRVGAGADHRRQVGGRPRRQPLPLRRQTCRPDPQPARRRALGPAAARGGQVRARYAPGRRRGRVARPGRASSQGARPAARRVGRQPARPARRGACSS